MKTRRDVSPALFDDDEFPPVDANKAKRDRTKMGPAPKKGRPTKNSTKKTAPTKPSTSKASATKVRSNTTYSQAVSQSSNESIVNDNQHPSETDEYEGEVLYFRGPGQQKGSIRVAYMDLQLIYSF